MRTVKIIVDAERKKWTMMGRGRLFDLLYFPTSLSAIRKECDIGIAVQRGGTCIRIGTDWLCALDGKTFRTSRQLGDEMLSSALATIEAMEDARSWNDWD